MNDEVVSKGSFRSAVGAFFKALGLVVAGVLVGAAALVVAMNVMGARLLDALIPDFTSREVVSESQVVQSLSIEDDVVLMRFGIQGIISDTKDWKINGLSIPGTSKAVYLQYSYKASVGIDGSAVKITKKGAKKYEVSVPNFVYLGEQDRKVEKVLTDDGVISFATPDVDETELNSRISEVAETDQLLADNREALELQAKSYYEGVARAVDPEVELTFDFAGDSGLAR